MIGLARSFKEIRWVTWWKILYGLDFERISRTSVKKTKSQLREV